MTTGWWLRRFGHGLIFLIFTLLAAVSVIWLVINLFKIKKIEIVSFDNLLINLDEKRLPRNLIFFPIGRIETQILATNPLVASVKITRKFPDTLVLELSRRPVLARLINGDQEILVGHAGVVITEITEMRQLPQLLINLGKFQSASAVTDVRVLAALEFLEETQLVNLEVESISVVDSLSLSAKIGKTEIIFVQSGQIAVIAATLQELLAGFRIKGSLPTRIDLRFDKPSVTF